MDGGSASQPAGKATLRTAKRFRFESRDRSRTFVLDRAGQALEAGATETELRDARLIARDLVTQQGKNFRYVARSAMHKEVRRGDVTAVLRWLHVNSLCGTPSASKEYFKAILLEETRNLDLAAAWVSTRGIPAEEMARSIAASAKKWETTAAAKGLYDLYMRGLALANVAGFKPLSDEELEARFRGGDADAIFDALWRVRGVGPLDRFNAVALRVAEDMDLPHVSTLRSRSRDRHYVADSLCELFAGLLPPDACTFVRPVFGAVPEDDPDEIYVPALPLYVYDNHTRPGRAAVIRLLTQLEPGKPSPQGLDLRWSGMLRGKAWRFSAFKQYGFDYVNKPWESVDIAPETWEATILADNFYFAEVCRAAGVKQRANFTVDTEF